MKNSKIVLWAVLALAASVCVSQAQPVLQVRFPFTNTDGLTTLASDTSSGGANVTLNMLNNSAAAAVFEGSPGGGVSGLGVALDFSTNTDFSITGIPEEGANGGTGPIAENTGSTALNFGILSNYTATIWFNANSQMPNTGGNATLGPRIFTLGASGTADKGVANSIGIFWQTFNEVAVSVGAVTLINTPTYANFVPTNQWLFYAFTVQNGTNVMIYGGTDKTNVMFLSQSNISLANGTLKLTNTLGSVLLVGNRVTGPQTRGFDGWLDDFRFYSGVATTNQLEDIRWSAVVPVALTAGIGDTVVALTWNSLGAATYNVLRSTTSGGPYTLIASGLASPSYSDTAVVNGTTYYYVVSAVDALGDGNTTANSAQVAATPNPAPAAPGNFTATAQNTSVLLSWNASAGSPAAVSYNIYKSLAPGGETLYANVPDSGGPVTTFTDTSVTNGITYYYKVAGVASGGAIGIQSAEGNAMPFGPPLAPTGLTIASETISSVGLRWADPNPADIQSEDGYEIFSSVNGGPFNQIGARGIGTNTFTDNTVTYPNMYTYEVVATNINEPSGPPGTLYTSADSATVTATISQVVNLADIAEQTVRAAADHAGVVNDNGSGTIPGPGVANAVGFLRVKYVNDGNPNGGDTTSCAKSYFRFSFAGHEFPNTNADLQMTWGTTTVAGSELTTMTLWSLNQSYGFLTGVPTPPGDGSTFVPPGGPTTGVTWDNAQANDTNYNPVSFTGTFQMLTNGAKTATAVVTFTDVGEGNSPTITIPAPWGNLIHQNNGTNEVVFCLGGLTFNQGAQGYRIANNSAALIYNATLGTKPPSLSVLTNMTVNAGQSAPQNFTVTDPAGNVNLVGSGGVAITTTTTLAGATVTSDTTGGASAQVTGSGANQTVTVTAGPTGGTCTFEVTITDEFNDKAQRTFSIVVPPPVSLSIIPTTNTVNANSLVIPFTVIDQNPAATLTVTGMVDSQSGPVLSNAVVAHVGGPNYTVTVTPVPDSLGGTNGIGFVDLIATDSGNNGASNSIPVMVQASAETVFSESFIYTPASSLILENSTLFGTPPSVNDGIWNLIGPAGPNLLNVVNSGTLAVNVTGNGEEGYANLLGAPYAPGHGYVIYTTFQGNWSAFTGFTWLSLGEFPGVAADQYAGVGNVPDAAADGGFNVTILNGPGGAALSVPETLQPGTTYNIAVRYDVDRASATLWVNATNETDPNGTNITATDIQVPAPINTVTINQNGAAGNASLNLDDLTVTVVQRPVVNSISIVGNNVQIVFTAGVNDSPSNFVLTGTTNLLTMPFSAVNPTITSMGGGVFKATLPVSANQAFYRLARQPFAFSY